MGEGGEHCRKTKNERKGNIHCTLRYRNPAGVSTKKMASCKPEGNRGVNSEEHRNGPGGGIGVLR
jgi:hypothetical protein